MGADEGHSRVPTSRNEQWICVLTVLHWSSRIGCQEGWFTLHQKHCGLGARGRIAEPTFQGPSATRECCKQSCAEVLQFDKGLSYHQCTILMSTTLTDNARKRASVHSKTCKKPWGCGANAASVLNPITNTFLDSTAASQRMFPWACAPDVRYAKTASRV